MKVPDVFEEDYIDRIVQIMTGEGGPWLTRRKRRIVAPVPPSAADAQAAPALAGARREQGLGPGRAVAAAIIQKGMRDGQFRSDLDVEVTLDLIFAPVYYRLVYGHQPLSEASAEQSVDQVLHGIV